MKSIFISILIGFLFSYLPYCKDLNGKYVEGFSWIISGLLKSLR